MEGEKKELQLKIAPTDYQLYIAYILNLISVGSLVNCFHNDNHFFNPFERS